ncbi:hypothetical protein DYE50_00675 [Treponema ruminis]|uniref:Uncharacterized protein n=1 Tax=Treponema ruminis TaxID=744515 RepID=A0A7W8LNF8_9SPIR|nr:hypothetical protein [Treponema ruminis]MBB5227462.1 hypothetical protein [Treponema ruminis]QSI01095.1 hypothetical protein DYE50_00675 [Treponema ruminis]
MKIFFGFFNPFFLCVLDKGYNSTEGLAKGAQQASISNAKNLLKLGVTPETIAQGCSLPLDQVLALKDELKTES